MHIANLIPFSKFLYSNARWWFVEPKLLALMTNIKETGLTAILRLYSKQYLGYGKFWKWAHGHVIEVTCASLNGLPDFQQGTAPFLLRRTGTYGSLCITQKKLPNCYVIRVFCNLFSSV